VDRVPAIAKLAKQEAPIAVFTSALIRARLLVAINNDKTAPIFSQSDCGIVGDVNGVVPALIGTLEATS
jgi:hypothetical protein